MSRRANPTLIGAFVVGALALLVAGLLILGTGRLGGDRETLVLYFRYNTQGLKIGAPVVLKGVQIGEVTDVAVAYDDETGRFQVPVYIEIDHDRVLWPQEIRGELDSLELYEKALEAGLRARLGLQSLVTGMRQIEAGFFPDTPLVLSRKESGYRELPTIPSSFDRLRGQVESLPLDHFVQQALAILEGLNRLVNAPELMRILANLDSASNEFSQASGEVRARLGPTGDRLDATMDDLQAATQKFSGKLDEVLIAVEQAAENVRRLAQATETEIGPVAGSLRAAGDSARSAFDTAEGTFDRLSSVVDQQSPLYREALTTLRSVAAAARTLRELADYLERHPESIIRGKR
jgi:paraquat-inducible protein B